MESLAKNLPQIIKESASSALGILALMIIGLAILAFFFFRQASEKTRIGIFAMLFVGVAVLAGTIVRATNKASGNEQDRRNRGTNTTVQNQDTNTMVQDRDTITKDVTVPGKYPKNLVVPAKDFKTSPGTYRILSATLEKGSEYKVTLDVAIRYTRGNDAWNGGTLMGENFRLLVDGVPFAPTKAPSEAVSVNSAKEGHVVFEIPSGAKKVDLQVGMRGEVQKIPLDLTATK